MTGYRPGDTDRRPWGNWTILDTGPGYAVKRIEVIPGGRLSLQRHRHRAERWVVVAGAGQATLDDAVFEVAVGDTMRIEVGQVHRLVNLGAVDVVFIEVQTGDDLREDDIERLEDVYGRT